MATNTLQVAKRADLFGDGAEQKYEYDEELLEELDRVFGATLDTTLRAVPKSNAIAEERKFRLLSVIRSISLLPKPLPPTLTRPPEYEDTVSAAKTRRRWARQAAVGVESLLDQAAKLPPPFRRGRVLHVAGSVDASKPAMLHLYRLQERRTTRPPVPSSQLQQFPYGAGPALGEALRIPGIEVVENKVARRKRTRHSRKRRNAYNVPSIPRLPSPSRRSSMNSFSFGPQQLVDLYLDANSSTASSLDPNRSILPASPLRSSPRHASRQKDPASTTRGQHPLANDTNIFQDEESDYEWGMVDRMRLWRHDALMQHLYETASFWGDKILSWTNDPNDAFWLAQTYFMTHQYSRAERLLTRPFPTTPPKRPSPLTNGHIGKGKEREIPMQRLPLGLVDVSEDMQRDVSRLVDMSVACRYLAAQCQVRQGNWSDATEMLGEANPFRNSGRSGPAIPNLDGGIKIEASMCHLRGVLMLKLGRGEDAKECFMEALTLDVKCFDAFEQLVSGEMMTPDEEWEFVQGLAYSQQTPHDASFVQLIYTARLRKYKHATEHALTRQRLVEEYGLGDNPDVLFSFADALYTQFRWADCFAITTRIRGLVSMHNPTMPLHIACMYHLSHLNSKLFILAHEMVDREPENAVSWYAVGIWYLSNQKWTEARQYFSKTSLMDPRFGPAWIAFAHTFALEGEHDHAVTAYSTCARMFTGSHLPLMFVGMENIMLSNYPQADEALNAAQTMCDGDPLLCNELGVMAYNHSKYEEAASFFRKALELASATQGSHKTWATTHLNLGTCYRKLHQYDAAEASYQKVLDLDPRHAQALGLLGMVYHLTDQVDKAILKYHEALSVEQLNPAIMELLNMALDQTTSVTPDLREFKSIVRTLRDKYAMRGKSDKGKGKQRADDGDAMNIGDGSDGYSLSSANSMSGSRKASLQLARLNDSVLGAFGLLLPHSEGLDHLLRLLSTWSGTEYVSECVLHPALAERDNHQQILHCNPSNDILVPLLHLRARLQHRAGLRTVPVSSAAPGIAKFASLISDSQTLGRFWGLLQIFQWLISLERTQQPTRNLLTIERLQGWSMLGYYPLEHLSYLRTHEVIPASVPSLGSIVDSTAKPITLDSNHLSRMSIRFWAVYVVLQFAHLREDRKLLQLQQRTLRKSKELLIPSEKQEIRRKWDAYWSGLLVNACNLPVALHWSVEGGVFTNPFIVNVLSFIAAVVSFRTAWKATALPVMVEPETISDLVAPPTETPAM
uniref:TPR-like protein n=1 Tax=Mycena chlorophos TaxID=658473 RepID=A0ABQ0MC27_MYCCL|nr:predicted protein [Mycena chlorophos]